MDDITKRFIDVYNYLHEGKFIKSDAELARLLGVTPPAISNIISGSSNAQIKIVQGISNAFTMVNVDWLLTGEGKMLKNLANNLKYIREEDGLLSVKEIADAIGIDENVYSDFESGVHVPKQNDFNLICSFLGIAEDKILKQDLRIPIITGKVVLDNEKDNNPIRSGLTDEQIENHYGSRYLGKSPYQLSNNKVKTKTSPKQEILEDGKKVEVDVDFIKSLLEVIRVKQNDIETNLQSIEAHLKTSIQLQVQTADLKSKTTHRAKKLDDLRGIAGKGKGAPPVEEVKAKLRK